MNFLKQQHSKNYLYWLGLLLAFGIIVIGILIYRATEAFDYFERKSPGIAISLP